MSACLLPYTSLKGELFTDPAPSPAAPPVASLPAPTSGYRKRLLRAPPCRVRVAAVVCGWLLPRRWLARSLRSKETSKTGDHGGIMCQPERDRSIRTAAAIQHALGNGYRALRAPASASVPSAGY